VRLPEPRGKLAVGRVALTIVDPVRLDPLSPDGATQRRVSVFVTYPAAASSGTPAPYAPGLWKSAIDQTLGSNSLFWKRMDRISTAMRDSALPADGKFPLILFEPGYGKGALDYTTLIQDLTSHGFVVAAITPTYSFSRTVIDDKIIPSSGYGAPDEDDESAFEAALTQTVVPVWIDDFEMVRCGLQALSLPILKAVRDFDRVGLMGHSLGGGAALEACARMTTCFAAVDIDGKTFVASESTKARLLIGLSQPRDFQTTLRSIKFVSPEATFHEAESDLAFELNPLLLTLLQRKTANPARTIFRISDLTIRHFNDGDSAASFP
jgi:hypothetical protein